jgi:Flp pilus assembly pilin Flp
MSSLVTAIERLIAKDDGQDLLEYGLLGVLIAVVVMTAVTNVGNRIYDVFWYGIGNAL